MTRNVKPLRLNRRHLLRGLLGGSALAVGLPPLDIMFNDHGTAYANGDVIQPRLGVWFWGNGTIPERFHPKNAGPDWELTEELAPLENLKRDITIVSGLELKPEAAGHFRGRSTMLSGAHSGDSRFEPRFGTNGGPSVDQIAAGQWEGQTQFRSLEVGVSIVGGNHTKQGVGTSSWNGPDDINPNILDPVELYKKLFSGGTPETRVDSGRVEAIRAARASLMDTVKADAITLSKQLGQADRLRLEGHLDGFREIERQLEFLGGTTCEVPPQPSGDGENRRHELLEEKNKVMADMTKVALACNMTRAFSFQYSSFQANTIFWQIGAKEGMHILTHDNSNNKHSEPELVHKAVVYLMGHYAYLLEALKSVPEGASNVLDNTLIMATSDVEHGQTHSPRNMPIIMAGSAGGRFQAGTHYIHKEDDNNSSRILLTMLRACGVDVTTVGAGDGRTDKPLSDLLIG